MKEVKSEVGDYWKNLKSTVDSEYTKKVYEIMAQKVIITEEDVSSFLSEVFVRFLPNLILLAMMKMTLTFILWFIIRIAKMLQKSQPLYGVNIINAIR